MPGAQPFAQRGKTAAPAQTELKILEAGYEAYTGFAEKSWLEVGTVSESNTKQSWLLFSLCW